MSRSDRVLARLHHYLIHDLKFSDAKCEEAMRLLEGADLTPEGVNATLSTLTDDTQTVEVAELERLFLL